jgi:hypothetical protein
VVVVVLVVLDRVQELAIKMISGLARRSEVLFGACCLLIESCDELLIAQRHRSSFMFEGIDRLKPF